MIDFSTRKWQFEVDLGLKGSILASIFDLKS